ncbi:MAG: WYL domain-containing protein [Frankia sp.]|nr:WYL domain-containing protein [Frankia sp.]
MRASRLVSVLLLLQARGRLTAREIADELEVSVRTIYRDLEALAEAGVPVVADRGAAGGYRLLDGYRTRLTGLTRDEADTLLLAGIPGPAAELGLGAELAAAELKLLAALPETLRSRATRVRECFHLDAPGWFRDAEPVPHLAEVADAVWQRRRIRVTYRRWRAPREVSRLLEPLGLVLKSGVWYLVSEVVAEPDAPATESALWPDPAADVLAASADDRRRRVYRVSNILTLAQTGETFCRPSGFDLAAYWAAWSARYESAVYRGQATVRLSPAGQELARYLLPVAVARAASQTASAPDADGWVRAVLPIESVRHARHQLLVLGPELEVLDPPELRAALALAARGLVERYRETPVPPRPAGPGRSGGGFRADSTKALSP